MKKLVVMMVALVVLLSLAITAEATTPQQWKKMQHEQIARIKIEQQWEKMQHDAQIARIEVEQARIHNRPVSKNIVPGTPSIGEFVQICYEASNPVAPIVEQKVQPKPKAQTTDTNPAVLALLGVAVFVGIGRKIIKKH